VLDLEEFCNNKTVYLVYNRIGKPIKLIDNDGQEIKEFTVPHSVTSIGDRVFYNCSGLTSITIGNSVTSIGEEAFWCCSGLTSIIIPYNVTSIGEYNQEIKGKTNVEIIPVSA